MLRMPGWLEGTWESRDASEVSPSSVGGAGHESLSPPTSASVDSVVAHEVITSHELWLGNRENRNPRGFVTAETVTSVGPNNLEPLVKVITGSFGPLVQGGVYSTKYLVLRLPLRLTYIHQIFRDIRIDPKIRPKGIEPAANRNCYIAHNPTEPLGLYNV